MSITGTVSHIGTNGRFGFIRPDGTPDDGSQNVHFLIREAPAEARRVGTKVEFDLEVPEPAAGPHAIKVKLFTAPAAHAAPPSTPTPAASPPAAAKPAEKPVPPTPKRMDIIVHPLTPSKENPITIICKGEDGKPQKGSVHINTGQRFKVKGFRQTFRGDHGFGTLDNGMLSLYIQLLECDMLATFLHEESGEIVQKTLLKEE